MASSLISEWGEGRGGSGVSFPFFFFKIVTTKYVLNSLGIYLFSDKIFVSLWHNLSPRADVNDKVAIITILMIKINQRAANLSYDLLFQLN